MTFGAKLLGLFTGSMLTKLIEIGYDTGLFEASRAGPATSEELAKRAEDVEEDEDDVVLDLAPGDDKAEALIEKVIPPQPNEFTCRNCFLVKHRSQLADKKKMLCRDCA